LTSALKAVHSGAQLGAAAIVDTTWYGMAVFVSPADSMKEGEVELLGLEPAGMDQGPRAQHGFGAKADQERV